MINRKHYLWEMGFREQRLVLFAIDAAIYFNVWLIDLDEKR